MKVFHHIGELRQLEKPVHLALGVFDGVHVGHQEVIRPAVDAAKTMGLGMCGVDILRSNEGPVVMEVNSSPGLEGIEGGE